MQHLEKPYDTWMGRTVKDPAGQRIGKVDDIYTDDDSGRPEWVAAGSGSAGSDVCLLPVAGATWQDDDDDLWVPFPREKVREAPRAGVAGRLSRAEVTRLRTYYACEQPRRSRAQRRAEKEQVAASASAVVEPAPVAIRDEPAPTPQTVERELVSVSASVAPGSVVVGSGGLDWDPPAPPAQQVSRERVSLSASFDKEPGGNPDSPLTWNHDDRIDSIRPAVDRWHARRR